MKTVILETLTLHFTFITLYCNLRKIPVFSGFRLLSLSAETVKPKPEYAYKHWLIFESIFLSNHHLTSNVDCFDMYGGNSSHQRHCFCFGQSSLLIFYCFCLFRPMQKGLSRNCTSGVVYFSLFCSK